MTGTTLTYNGISIVNCLSDKLVQENIRDESGTDVLYLKTTLHVKGHIHLHNPISIHGIAAPDPTTQNNAPLIFQAVRDKLMEDRKELSYASDAGTIFAARHQQSSGAALAGYDMNNGPKPKLISIKPIGSVLFEVEFEIEACTIECADDVNNSGVLSNRWEVSDEIDQNFYTTRTYKGTLLLAGHAGTDIGPQAFRKLVVPPLGKGFIRERILHATSRDGLKLEYVIVDRQTSNAPPPPATKWSGTHTVSTDETGKTFAEISIHLEGPESGGNDAKRKLMSVAAAIAQAKLNVFNSTKSHLLQLAFIDHLGENAIDINIRVMYVGQVLNIALLDSTGLGLAIDSPDRRQGLVPKLFGTTTPTGLFVARLQSPCEAGTHAIPESVSPNDSNRSGTSQQVGEPEGYEGNNLLDTFANRLSNTDNSMYTDYLIKVEYIIQPNLVKCPIACRSIGHSPDATAMYFPVGLPTADKRILVRASRIGAWPDVPAPIAKFTDEFGIVHYLTKPYRVTALAPELTANGVAVLYSIECEYYYGLSRPPRDSEKLLVGSLPWQRIDGANRYILPSSFIPPTANNSII